MATEKFINELKNRANANRLGRFDLQMYDRFEKEFKGDTYQNTTKGLQLLKKEAFSTPKSDTDYWENSPNTTPLTDGWCKVEKDNSSGTSNVYVNNYLNTASIDYEVDTDYTIIFEWRNASNVAGCNLSQPSQAKNPFSNDAYATVTDGAGIAKRLVRTKSSLVNDYLGIRNFFTVLAGKKMSLEVRVMIVKGDYTNQDVDFEYYTGGMPSPSPDYPQEIQSVNGLQNIEVCGKNLFNIEKMIEDNYTLISHTGSSYEIGFTKQKNYINVNIETNKSYVFKFHIDAPKIDTYFYLIYDDDTIKLLGGRTSSSQISQNFKFTINETKKVKQIEFRHYNLGGISSLTISNVQLEEGNDTEYEPYKGNDYEINLGKNKYKNPENIYSTRGTTTRIDDNSFSIEYNKEEDVSQSWYCQIQLDVENFEPNTTYTLSKKSIIDGPDFEYAGAIRTYINGSYGSTTKADNITFTTPSVLTSISILFYGGWNATGTGKQKIVFSDIQIEKGQQTNFSPYFTPIELNSIPETEYKDTIKKSTGKNLFNIMVWFNNSDLITTYGGSKIITKDYISLINPEHTDQYMGGYWHTSSTPSQQQIDKLKIFAIEVKPNTKYTFSYKCTNKNQVFCFQYDENYVYKTATHTTVKVDGKNTFEIQTGNDIKYIALRFDNEGYGSTPSSDNTFSEIMLVEGNDSDYEPYLSKGTWYAEKQTKKIIFNGNETWNYTSGARERFTTSISDIALQEFNDNAPTVAISDYFVGTNWHKLYGDTSLNNALSSHNAAHQLNIRATQFNGSVDEFKTWLSTNKPEVIYATTVPETIEITNTELISQLEAIELLKGENNITITSEDLPIIFDYSFWNGDTEVDVDDRFLEINQSNHLTKIELKDSCCVNNNLLGTTYTKSAEVELLDLPMDTKLEGKTIIPEVGVRYDDDTTEYETFDNYTIESLNDEQTASNTKFTAMSGGTLLDSEYICSLSFENGQTHTINEFYQDALSQIGITPTDTTFDNSEIEMTGNPFTNKESIRILISEVEKVSCTIIDFDWKNKTASMTWLSDQIDYEFNISDYSTLEGSLAQYGPLNTIIIANAELNGENVVMKDDISVTKDGEHQIIIDSPYFLYTEALRRQAIEAIYNKLVGLTYYDIKLTTPYGKPFLKKGNKIRINTNEGQTYDTYVLTHTLTYDGAIQSVIESPALTQEEQTIQNNIKNNTIKERVRRTELMVDKTTGEITAVTERVTTAEDEIGNMYSKEEVNTLVQTSQAGLTNTFSEAGGNNIFRNTGLWFTQNDTNNPFEFWNGNVVKAKEEKASNYSALLLQNAILSQEQLVPNGNYTISFKYKKLVQLAKVKCIINDIEIELDSLTDKEIIQVLEVNAQHINIQFVSDTANSCEIYDLMVNAGSVKLAYSQNQNETTTDTVNISKGITITSSDIDVTFKANADGIRTLDRNGTRKTEFTDTGMITTRATIEEEAEVVSLLHKRVGNHIWVNKI